MVGEDEDTSEEAERFFPSHPESCIPTAKPTAAVKERIFCEILRVFSVHTESLSIPLKEYGDIKKKKVYSYFYTYFFIFVNNTPRIFFLITCKYTEIL